MYFYLFDMRTLPVIFFANPALIEDLTMLAKLYLFSIPGIKDAAH